ncbi:MAG: serine/threonine protein kinase, partial [Actinomycetota bacterium]|nr:serine/threonine protein kinase [Actinomycetota bacterium]
MHHGGTVLAGRYRVVRHVGSGGMGTVYLANDTALGRDVAVKSVHAAPDSDHGRRIMREARLGAGLRHPHLVTVFDVVPWEGALLLVMEYVEGETLADALRRGPLEVPRALAVLRAVAGALDHAHSRGVV